jgi:hypothetical protein
MSSITVFDDEPGSPFLKGKVFEFLDPKKVASIKDEAVRAQEKKNRGAFKKKHPVRWFFLSVNPYASVLILILAGILYQYISLMSAGLAFIAAAFFGGWTLAVNEELKGKPWDDSPFRMFEKGYTGSIAHELSDCARTRCLSELVELRVHWHKFSPIRFLVIRDRLKPNSKVYFLEQWEEA